jgi:hypothetical protein
MIKAKITPNFQDVRPKDVETMQDLFDRNFTFYAKLEMRNIMRAMDFERQ